MSKKLFICLISCIILIIILSLLLIFIDAPTITLKGDSKIVLKLGEKYEELGINEEGNVIISGEVNTSTVGEYIITYELNGSKITRTISVIDDIAPTITLDGPKDVYLYLGNEYEDFGATAEDNYDGNLDNKISIDTSSLDINKIGDYKIEYTVIDSSNNKTSIYRNIHVISMNKSEIKSIPILMYHFFYDSSKGEKGVDSNWIEITKFEEQIKYLVDNNYYFPTWQEINLYLDSKIKLPDKSIIITVDDGDPSFFKLGVKVLEKYKVRATSFMVTNWYSPSNYEYNSSLISIQSHSHDMHKGGCNTGHGGIFQCIEKEKGINDLKTSISITKNNDVFCYPFGDYNEYEKTILKEVGFKMAVTTEYGKIKPGIDKLELPRIRVSGGNSLNYFIKSIN